ncbi:unnamed protein product, partial [Darwinula stevensoni]
GRVYNVSRYLEYHPGGEEELMKGAGKDATDLFNQVHRWVNFESLLQKCLIGKLQDTKPISLQKQRQSLDVLSSHGPPSPSSPSRKGEEVEEENEKVSIRWDWHETPSTLEMSFYTKTKKRVREEDVLVDLAPGNDTLSCTITLLPDHLYTLSVTLAHPVQSRVMVRSFSNADKVCLYESFLGTCYSRRVSLYLKKVTQGLWKNLGEGSDGDGELRALKDAPVVYREWEVTRKEEVTHNTRLLQLQAPPTCLHLRPPLGYHVHIRLHISEGVDVVRSYTPVASGLEDLEEKSVDGGHIYLLVKIYQEGALTPQLDALQVGQKVEVSNPEGGGNPFDESKLERCQRLVLLAAGTGFTPMVRLLLRAIRHPEKQVLLVLFNRTKEDIIWMEELDSLSQVHPNFQVEHILSESSGVSWAGHRGRISRSLLDQLLPIVEEDQHLFICVCGPQPFCQLAHQCLDELQYSSEQIHMFQG